MLVQSLPALAGELRGVFEMLDAGEALVVDGVDDPLAKAGLKALCASIGCDEVKAGGEGGNGESAFGYEAPPHVRAEGILRSLGDLLPAPESTDAVGSSSGPSDASDTAAAKRVLGPARPSEAQLTGSAADGDGDDDDDDVGPLLPDDPRAALRADRSAAAQAAEREAREAAAADAASRRSRGGGKRDDVHDAWMSLPSEALFGGGKEGTGGGAGGGNPYATKSAPKAGLGWSYLAKSAAPDSAPGASASSGGAAAGAASKASAAGSSKSANYMEQVAQARGGSLVDQYQRTLGPAAAAVAPTQAAVASAPGRPAERRPFDRDRDLQIPRQTRDPAKVVDNAKALAGRFSSGRFDRNFM